MIYGISVSVANWVFISFLIFFQDSEKVGPGQKSVDRKKAESVIEEFCRSHNAGAYKSFSNLLSDEVQLSLIWMCVYRAGLDRESPGSILFFESLKDNLNKYSIATDSEALSKIFNEGDEGLSAFSGFARRKELTTAVVTAYYKATASKPEYYVKKKTLSVEENRARVDLGIRVSHGIMNVSNSGQSLDSKCQFAVFLRRSKSDDDWVICTREKWRGAID